MADSIDSIIAAPLRKTIVNDRTSLYRVAIQLDTSRMPYAVAYRQLEELIRQLLETASRTEQHILDPGDEHSPLVKARLQGELIEALVWKDQSSPGPQGPVIQAISADIDDERFFNPDNLIRTVISVPLLRKLEADEDGPYDIQIEVNFNYAGGRPSANYELRRFINDMIAGFPRADISQSLSVWKSDLSDQYVYATLTGSSIRALVQRDEQEHQKHTAGDDRSANREKKSDWHTIYHIWPDFKLRAQIWRSVSTVKADACRRSFATTGRGIVWAIMDSGIDGSHPHFQKHQNLVVPSGLDHLDFTAPQLTPIPVGGLIDDYGHGTHVAGIVAGELDSQFRAVSLSRERDQSGKISFKGELVGSPVMGVAPECKLLNYKVLDKNGEGNVSTVIAAIQKVQQLNGYGRNIIIHGVNMSLGYDFDPEWFACGQSPICVEVDRLVRSGVAVVIAAGNTGRGFALTINDPGNAQLAVTVGATHRDMPHRYGVSYFSSKGPTADGRAKPDLLAPGERIISCGAGPDLVTYLNMVKQAGTDVAPEAGKTDAFYLERSGTSMAAPHVSGIIAGILSTRGEFVGLPEDLKDILVNNAIDLGRERNFQGGGLVDMMKAIQAM